MIKASHRGKAGFESVSAPAPTSSFDQPKFARAESQKGFAVFWKWWRLCLASLQSLPSWQQCLCSMCDNVVARAIPASHPASL